MKEIGIEAKMKFSSNTTNKRRNNQVDVFKGIMIEFIIKLPSNTTN